MTQWWKHAPRKTGFTSQVADRIFLGLHRYATQSYVQVKFKFWIDAELIQITNV